QFCSAAYEQGAMDWRDQPQLNLEYLVKVPRVELFSQPPLQAEPRRPAFGTDTCLPSVPNFFEPVFCSSGHRCGCGLYKQVPKSYTACINKNAVLFVRRTGKSKTKPVACKCSLSLAGETPHCLCPPFECVCGGSPVTSPGPSRRQDYRQAPDPCSMANMMSSAIEMHADSVFQPREFVGSRGRFFNLEDRRQKRRGLCAPCVLHGPRAACKTRGQGLLYSTTLRRGLRADISRRPGHLAEVLRGHRQHLAGLRWGSAEHRVDRGSGTCAHAGRCPGDRWDAAGATSEGRTPGGQNHVRLLPRRRWSGRKGLLATWRWPPAEAVPSRTGAVWSAPTA
ncbi:unnamed protein product, partial [Ixodes pacificus]